MTATPAVASVGLPIEFDPADNPTALYRLFDAAWNLLYIGISENLARRLQDHKEKQLWWPQVAHGTVALYACREDAEEAEDAAIIAEQPRHNVQGARNAA